MESDKEILEHRLAGLLREDSVSAFNAIYRLYARRLLTYISSATKNKEDAEEIVHDIFLSLWNRRHDLDPEQSLSTLLYSIAYRRRIDYFRRLLHMPVYEDYVDFQNALPVEDHSGLEYREFCRMFQRALDTLPQRHRQVVTLSRLEGLSNREISDKLNISEKTVRNVLSSALKTLHQVLMDYRTSGKI